jgi:hypothetical protein
LREFQSGAGSIARADDRHRRLRQRGGVTAQRNQRRRVVDHLQPQRVIGLAQSDERDTELPRGRNLPFRVLARADRHGARVATASRQRR